MSTIPMCAQCGSQLRWLVERSSWGCDRCRTMLVPVAPISRAPAAPVKRSNWFVILGVVVMICGGVATGLVLTRNERGPSCGPAGDNSLELSKAYLPVKLDPGEVKEVVTRRCEGDGWTAAVIACFGRTQRSEDPDSCMEQLTDDQRDKLGSDLAKLIASSERAPTCKQTFGHVVTITKLAGDGLDTAARETLKAAGIAQCLHDDWSEEALRCFFDATRESHVTECRNKLPKTPQENLTKLLGVKAAGSSAGSAGSAGAGAAGGSAGSGGAGGGSAGAGGGSAGVGGGSNASKSGSGAGSAGSAGAGSAGSAGAGSAGSGAGSSATNAGSGAGGAGAGSAGGAGAGSAGAGSGAKPVELPAECLELKAAFEKLSVCKRLPSGTRDALKKGLEKMLKGWSELGPLTADTRRVETERCKQNLGLIKKSRAICAAPDTPATSGGDSF